MRGDGCAGCGHGLKQAVEVAYQENHSLHSRRTVSEPKLGRLPSRA